MSDLLLKLSEFSDSLYDPVCELPTRPNVVHEDFWNLEPWGGSYSSSLDSYTTIDVTRQADSHMTVQSSSSQVAPKVNQKSSPKKRFIRDPPPLSSTTLSHTPPLSTAALQSALRELCSEKTFERSSKTESSKSSSHISPRNTATALSHLRQKTAWANEFSPRITGGRLGAAISDRYKEASFSATLKLDTSDNPTSHHHDMYSNTHAMRPYPLRTLNWHQEQKRQSRAQTTGSPTPPSHPFRPHTTSAPNPLPSHSCSPTRTPHSSVHFSPATSRPQSTLSSASAPACPSFSSSSSSSSAPHSLPSKAALFPIGSRPQSTLAPIPGTPTDGSRSNGGGGEVLEREKRLDPKWPPSAPASSIHCSETSRSPSPPSTPMHSRSAQLEALDSSFRFPPQVQSDVAHMERSTRVTPRAYKSAPRPPRSHVIATEPCENAVPGLPLKSVRNFSQHDQSVSEPITPFTDNFGKLKGVSKSENFKDDYLVNKAHLRKHTDKRSCSSMRDLVTPRVQKDTRYSDDVTGSPHDHQRLVSGRNQLRWGAKPASLKKFRKNPPRDVKPPVTGGVSPHSFHCTFPELNI